MSNPFEIREVVARENLLRQPVMKISGGEIAAAHAWGIDAVSAYPTALTAAYAATFTGEPGDTYQPEKCRHTKGSGCEYCCHLCNFGRHICPGCGASLHHNENACVDCRAAAANETQIAEINASLAPPD